MGPRLHLQGRPHAAHKTPSGNFNGESKKMFSPTKTSGKELQSQCQIIACYNNLLGLFGIKLGRENLTP